MSLQPQRLVIVTLEHRALSCERKWTDQANNLPCEHTASVVVNDSRVGHHGTTLYLSAEFRESTSTPAFIRGTNVGWKEGWLTMPHDRSSNKPRRPLIRY